jgi:hypothetical protein
MRTAHLILVHKNPIQIERMLKRMYHPNFDFFIHVDKKVDIKPYFHLGNLTNVFFVKNRVDIKWGGYSIIKAAFNGINESCRNNQKYNFINFLSGQDYPIKPIEEIASFFQDNIGKEFIQYKDIISDWKEAQRRYKRYHLTEFKFKGSTRLERIINYFFQERKMPYKLHPYGESMFWMLSPEVALYVMNRVQGDKKLESFFNYVWAGDEFLFQTLIMDSPYRDRVINNNFRYIDWSEKKANPKALEIEDFSKLKKSSMLFARKFDIEKSGEILDMIDLII